RLALATAFSFGLFSSMSHAATFAVFGDNEIDNFINETGVFRAMIVSDEQLATDGFLNQFDAFIYTRNGASIGESLSTEASANVREFVTGNTVLLNADIANTLGPDGIANQLFYNALLFSTSGSGGGFIGGLQVRPQLLNRTRMAWSLLVCLRVMQVL
ncbi:MAG: hypothetical protein AAGE89_09265, partial [Pseudomonadota bacterium]